ncbi:MAG: hypothetical protein AUJ24_00305 [Parcubacteria group bacterium CG1_02_36_42]|nr:MAG: hypothetical protein AUJ24_00305 [Parcubacteria group bacterium CG1_02_36_42]
MIEEYHFGSITIDGKTYNHDVEVRWDKTVLKWWRKESHFVYPEDVKRAIEQNPEVIVIGTGESGVMEVGKDAKKEIESRGIELIIDITEEAIKTFNIINEESKKEEGEQKKVIGLFHLTC